MSMHREWTWNIYSLHKFYETPNFYGLQIIRQCPTKLAHIRRNHIQLFRERLSEKVHATIPKGNMGYDQYTVPDDCSCRTYFCRFPLALANTFPWPFVPILSNSFEKKRTQNHPQCLSGLSRALFLTTFLETAVCGQTQFPANRWMSLWKWSKYTLSNCELSYQQSNIISVNKTVIGLTLQTSHLPNTVRWRSLTPTRSRMTTVLFFPIKVASWPAKCPLGKSNYLQPWIFKGNP